MGTPIKPLPEAVEGWMGRLAVLAVLHEPRFVDLAPAEVYATLLVCSFVLTRT